MIRCEECGQWYEAMTDAYRCPDCGTSNYPDEDTPEAVIVKESKGEPRD